MLEGETHAFGVATDERMFLSFLTSWMLHQACSAARAGDAVGLLRLYVGAPHMAPYLMARTHSAELPCAVSSIRTCCTGFFRWIFCSEAKPSPLESFGGLADLSHALLHSER